MISFNSLVVNEEFKNREMANKLGYRRQIAEIENDVVNIDKFISRIKKYINVLENDTNHLLNSDIDSIAIEGIEYYTKPIRLSTEKINNDIQEITKLLNTIENNKTFENYHKEMYKNK